LCGATTFYALISQAILTRHGTCPIDAESSILHSFPRRQALRISKPPSTDNLILSNPQTSVKGLFNLLVIIKTRYENQWHHREAEPAQACLTDSKSVGLQTLAKGCAK
jgi:hypothetical protein